MTDALKRFFSLFTSLRLTVILLFFSLLLVFFGTLDQVKYGIRHTQDLYFESWLVLWQYEEPLPFARGLRWIHLPLPGGYLLGGLLFINLLAAHFRYYKAKWRKTGIILIHLGLLLLLVSGFWASFSQVESQMWIEEGERTNYHEDFYRTEFVLVAKGADEDTVASVPGKALRAGYNDPLEFERFGLRVRPLTWFANTAFARRADNPHLQNTGALALDRRNRPVLFREQVPPLRGLAGRLDFVAIAARETYKPDEINLESSYVVVEDLQTGEPVGTFLVSNFLTSRNLEISQGLSFGSQSFVHEGQTYEIALRLKRYYNDYTLALEDFRFDRYPGTEIPMNFSSDVVIDNPVTGENRGVKIYMNHPLRYEGLTYYQASFDPNTETATMFQVVRNPGWQLPYWAVLLVGVGLVVQFTLSLLTFLRRRHHKSGLPAVPSPS